MFACFYLLWEAGVHFLNGLVDQAAHEAVDGVILVHLKGRELVVVEHQGLDPVSENAIFAKK